MKRESFLSQIFAAIDIGTNSIRLAVVRLDGHNMTTLDIQRQVVRLGEGEFDSNLLTRDAIDRGALVCARFAETARGYGAQEIVAFATSAVREADNREEFIDKVRREADIEVKVISGVEEARLIWIGVSSGVDLLDKRAVLIDIGGGSTEVIVGDSAGYAYLDSMRLGAIRLSNRFFPDGSPVSPDAFEMVKRYVQGIANQVIRRVKQEGFQVMMGSAGTITALGEIVSRRTSDGSGGRTPTIRLTDLRETVQALCKMTIEERRNAPGMDANRAEIILGGAAIVLTLMEEFGAETLTVSDRGLRDGILTDHAFRGEEAQQQYNALSVRRRSILQLARACNYEEAHSAHISFLAGRLFEEFARLGVHQFGEVERELLEYAAITHDIGSFLSHSNHHKHAYYLIRNYDLLGFNDTEIDIIANSALFHHKGLPKRRHPHLIHLDRDERRKIEILSAILRMSEGLDRSHLALVQDVRLEAPTDAGLPFTLFIRSEANCELEVWGVQNSLELFQFVFGAPLKAVVESS